MDTIYYELDTISPQKLHQIQDERLRASGGSILS
jgi:hypothetical protein